MATIVLGIMGTLTQVAISLRLYTRKKLTSALGIGLDDYIMVAASFCIAFVMISGTIGKLQHNPCACMDFWFLPYKIWLTVDSGAEVLGFGLGEHTFNESPSMLLPNLLMFWLDEVVYQLAMLLVKCSILCFYVNIPYSHLGKDSG